MAVFDNIRLAAAKALLPREAGKVKREQQFFNFQSANSVGLLFRVETEAHIRQVRTYVNRFREEGIKSVKALGYWDEKELPDWAPATLEFDYVTRNDLGFTIKPKNVPALNFVQEPFDLLIDLNFTECWPLKWALALSGAHMKVGLNSPENQELYDFMISMDEPANIPQFMKQVTHYLSPGSKQAS